MLKSVAIVMCVVALSANAYARQASPAEDSSADQAKSEAKPAEGKTAPPAIRAPEPLPVNIKIEVSITDQSGNNPPAKKTVSMVVGDRQRNSIRSSANVPVKVLGNPNNFNYRNVTINVDAHPTIVQKEPTKLSLDLGLQYQPKSGGGQEDLEPGMASLNESMSLILESGKAMIVSQAADPTSDRKITVEVIATILK